MSLQRYADYKDTGKHQLPELPAHWAAVRVKRLGTLKGGAGFPHEHQGLAGEELSFHKVNALAQTAPDGTLLPSGDTVNYDVASKLGAFVFPERTIVFAKVGAALLLGRMRSLGKAACLDNNMMGLVVTPDASHQFVRYALGLTPFEFIVNPGAVPSVNERQVGELEVAFPPLSEQIAIASFLDRETAKIDALVAEQRRLIELLKEKREAVISHTVTKGLRPHSPMTRSGIGWLGDVPKHWSVISFRHSVRCIFNGLTIDQVDQSETTVPVTRIETISSGIIDYARVGFINRQDARADRRLVPSDILFSNINSLNMIGNCAFYEGERELFAGMNLLVIRRALSRHGRWLFWVVRSGAFRHVVESLAKPAINQASISQASILGIRIPVPPPEEQLEIAHYLDVKTAEFDALSGEAEHIIDLLRERRTALISAAVTGQIDVRALVRSEVA